MTSADDKNIVDKILKASFGIIMLIILVVNRNENKTGVLGRSGKL